MMNHSPRRLLSIDCKQFLVRRYEDRRCTGKTEMVIAGGVDVSTLQELEAFRMYGFSGIPYAPGPQAA